MSHIISTKSELSLQLSQLDDNQLSQTIPDLAKQFAVTEYELVSALPSVYVTLLEQTFAEDLLEELPNWGALTTIVMAGKSIFEFKGNFPPGKSGYGYYNLYGSDPQGLYGHLQLDEITAIALLEKPFRGQPSYSILFFAQDGSCLFKIYLGRDSQRRVFPEQIARFNALRHQFTQQKSSPFIHQ